jgi:hypothetical protein
MKDLSRINRELRTEVYNRAWDRDRLRELRAERERKEEEIEQTRTAMAQALALRSMQGAIAGGPAQEPMDVRDTWVIANALHASRPPVYEREQWVLFRRICASLMNLFVRELSGGGEDAFDPLEFLSHCGLPFKEAELLAGTRGDPSSDAATESEESDSTQ